MTHIGRVVKLALDSDVQEVANTINIGDDIEVKVLRVTMKLNRMYKVRLGILAPEKSNYFEK